MVMTEYIEILTGKHMILKIKFKQHKKSSVEKYSGGRPQIAV